MSDLKPSADQYKTEGPYLGFFAYSRTDERRLGGKLKEIHEVLERELTDDLGVSGGRIYLDVNMGPGSEYKKASAEVLENCYFLIVCVSDAAILDSELCAWECQKFIDRENVLGANLAYPIVVDTVNENEGKPLNAVERIYRDRNRVDIHKHLLNVDAKAQLDAVLKELAGWIKDGVRPVIAKSIRETIREPAPFAALYERTTNAPVQAGLILTVMLLISFVIWNVHTSTGVAGLEMGHALPPAVFAAYAVTPLSTRLFVTPNISGLVSALVALALVFLALLFSLLALSSIEAAILAAVADVAGLWILLSLSKFRLSDLPFAVTIGPALSCCLVAALIPFGAFNAMHPAVGAGTAALCAIWLLVRNLYVLERVARL